MLKLYTIHYNNYFNRKVLQESALADYLVSAYFTNGHVTSNVSFNEGDGITTSQIINYKPKNDDYAILVRETTVDNVTASEIVSRWFILEDNKQRTGQYDLKLQRDVIVDNFNSLLEAPIFVEKGNLNENDNMICNNEGMAFNQIKINEEPLKMHQDDTPWIVGYVTKKELREGDEIISDITVAPSDVDIHGTTISDIAQNVGITESQLVSMLNIDVATPTNQTHSISNVEVNYGLHHGGMVRSKVFVYLNNDFTLSSCKNEGPLFGWEDYPIENLSGIEYQSWEINRATEIAWATVETTTSDIEKILSSVQTNSLSNSTYNKLLDYNNTFVVYNNQKYKMTITFGSSTRHELNINANQTQLNELLNRYRDYSRSYLVRPEGTAHFWCTDLTIYVILTTPEENQIHIPFSNSTDRRDCAGSVCDIFAIPYGNMTVLKTSQDEKIIDFRCLNDKDMLFKFASTIATKLSTQLYDIQLLPYCPIPIDIDTQGGYTGVDIPSLEEGKDFDYIYYLDGDTHINKSIIYWLKNANFTSQLVWNRNSSNRKIDSQTKIARITSPSGNGIFDFNIAKNNGIHNFTLNMTFKPFSPYIQVLPNFSGLYGNNFNDYRGLICSGDFSLTRIEDAWIQYQLNNKNYQNIFNRDIESMDFQFSQQKAKQILTSGAKVVGGTASGAIAGAKIGGVPGAIAGAVVGAGVSTATVGIDWQMQEEARAQTKDYAIDKFNYSLGNIQAQPQSLTKVDSFIINSKLFPFIEFYDCTEAEKLALENKIKYNGMTVNRIGTISEFKVAGEEHWFQGQLIRAEIESGNAKMLNACYNELLKGVYI